MRFDALQIGEAINVNDIVNVVLNTDGVVTIISSMEDVITSKSVDNAFFDVISETTQTYNDTSFSPISSYEDGLVYPDRGGIFEMKYTARDIVVEVV